jgi:hypothetical protein
MEQGVTFWGLPFFKRNKERKEEGSSEIQTSKGISSGSEFQIKFYTSKSVIKGSWMPV